MDFLKEDESLAQYFYNKLVEKGSNPGVVLTQFFCKYYNIDFNQQLIGRLGKLVNLYGRNITFLAMLDLFEVEDVSPDHFYGLLLFLIKKRVVNKFSIQEQVDLTKQAEEYTKRIAQLTKHKPKGVDKSPFDDE